MAKFNLVLPVMGEGVIEATINKWLKSVGDNIKRDEIIVEVATDKVDNELPSPVSGTILDLKFPNGTVVEIGKTIAVIETSDIEEDQVNEPAQIAIEPNIEMPVTLAKDVENNQAKPASASKQGDTKFYSPLVRNIAREENIDLSELDSITGTGAEGRLTKQDILDYVKNKKAGKEIQAEPKTIPAKEEPVVSEPKIILSAGDEIVEMSRVRKIIAGNTVQSKHVAPHVTSVIEADVTKIVHWREKIKTDFEKAHATKLTYTHILIEAVMKALIDYPLINVSVDGSNIIIKKNINLGIATALPNGELIIPVVKNADQLNLIGLAKSINDLTQRARDSKLRPEEIKGGTFSVTNLGTFGTMIGTPIINQPEAAILGLGAIVKKPVVVETEEGDEIAIRSMIYLSLSYDHRVIDGALAGKFIFRIKEYLESFDKNRGL